MTKISDLSDDLLVKILPYLPTKLAVSTSVLSKQWEFLWMWSPKLEFDAFNDINYFDDDLDPDSYLRYRDFIAKNLPLHRAPILESLRLNSFLQLLQPEDIKSWASIPVSRCVRELSIDYFPRFEKPDEPAVYSCKTLVTLKLSGNILVDITQIVGLPSLKTLKLEQMTYANDNSLRLLINNCPVLEDLSIKRDNKNDNAEVLIVFILSLLRLSLRTEDKLPSISFKDRRFLVSITYVKRLSLKLVYNSDEEPLYEDGVVFSQLEHLTLHIIGEFWSRFLVRLLKDSPKQRVLNLDVDISTSYDYEPDSLNSEQSSVPKCLLNSLEIFEFKGCKGPEEKDFLSYISKHARCLKSSSIFP